MTIPKAIHEPLIAGELEKAANLLQAELEKNPGNQAVALELARVHLGLNQLEDSEKIFTPLLDNAETKGAALGIRGLWHKMQKRDDDAKTDFLASLKLDNEQSAVHYNLGHLLVHQPELNDGDAKKAEEHLQKALEIDKEHFQAQFELGALYTRLNKPVEAIVACQKTIELNPLHMRAYFFLGEMLNVAGRHSESADLFKAGLQVNPMAYAFRDELIRLHRVQGQFEDAFKLAMEQSRARGILEDFLELGNLALLTDQAQVAEIAFVKAEEVNDKDWRPAYNLGEIYRNVNEEEAEKAYKRSMEKAETAQGHAGLGLLYFEQEGKLEQATKHFEQALILAPENPSNLLNLALAFEKSGQKEEIQKAFDDYKNMYSPEDEVLKEVEALLK